MSIIIKGLDMPKKATSVTIEWWDENDQQIRFDDIEAHEIFDKVIEIPPHGRLIDKDELLSHLKKDPLFDLVERYGVSGVIESRPTIIEAEE